MDANVGDFLNFLPVFQLVLSYHTNIHIVQSFWLNIPALYGIAKTDTKEPIGDFIIFLFVC